MGDETVSVKVAVHIRSKGIVNLFEILVFWAIAERFSLKYTSFSSSLSGMI